MSCPEIEALETQVRLTGEVIADEIHGLALVLESAVELAALVVLRRGYDDTVKKALEPMRGRRRA